MAIVTVTLCSVGRASAQDDSKVVGITMGYPDGVGILWQATDRVAIRPQISVQRTSDQFTSSLSILGGLGGATSTSVSTIEGWQTAVGVSALFYLSGHEGLRTYLSPGWSYTRWSLEDASTIPDSDLVTNTTTGHSLSGSFGAQYALGRRFSVFGEVGFAYAHTKSVPTRLTSFSSTRTAWTAGTRSGAGVVFYF